MREYTRACVGRQRYGEAVFRQGDFAELAIHLWLVSSLMSSGAEETNAPFAFGAHGVAQDVQRSWRKGGGRNDEGKVD